jgi:hypothetical protein
MLFRIPTGIGLCSGDTAMRRWVLALCALSLWSGVAEARGGGHSGGSHGGRSYSGSAHVGGRSFGHSHYVRTYTRRDGTVVRGHTAADPGYGSGRSHSSGLRSLAGFPGLRASSDEPAAVGIPAAAAGVALGATLGYRGTGRLGRRGSSVDEILGEPEVEPVAIEPTVVGEVPIPGCTPETPGYIEVSGIGRCPAED